MAGFHTEEWDNLPTIEGGGRVLTVDMLWQA